MMLILSLVQNMPLYLSITATVLPRHMDEAILFNKALINHNLFEVPWAVSCLLLRKTGGECYVSFIE